MMLALLAVNHIYGQGALGFSNRSQEGEAPVSLPNGTLVAGEAYTAGLLQVKAGSLELIATTPFRTGAAAGFFGPVGVTVPGTPRGFPATFRVRVWETSAGSYEGAIATGKYNGEFQNSAGGNEFFVRELGGGGPISDPSLSGMLPLTLVPEPAPIALLALGALLLIRHNSFRYRDPPNAI